MTAERMLRLPAHPIPAEADAFPKLLDPEQPGDELPLESPSLVSGVGADVPAYEVKFLLNEEQAHELMRHVGNRLELDAHADPALGSAYRTTSLYCDTPALDVFHRLGVHKRRKHRIRRYDRSPWIFLERKSKWGDRVKKRRIMVPDADLVIFQGALSATSWSGHWFHRHLRERQLGPMCAIAYDRVALIGRTPEGPMRLTLDRNIRGVVCRDWTVPQFESGTPILTGQVICEFKYRSSMPALFKEIVQAMHLSPSPVSKYRTFMRTMGYGADRRAVDV